MASNRITYTEMGMANFKNFPIIPKNSDKFLTSFKDGSTIVLKHLLQKKDIFNKTPINKPSRSKRGQSLLFLENNKETMDKYHQSLRAKYQKPTIFSMINDPYNDSKDFDGISCEKRHRTMPSYHSELSKNKTELITSEERINNFSINNFLKTIITKPIILDFKEENCFERMTQMKIEYEQNQKSLFEKIKEQALKKREEKLESGKRSGFLERFKEENERINMILKRVEHEKGRFLKRLKKYGEEKFLIK